MPKPPPPRAPALFPDASVGARTPPQTVSVADVVESVRTGVPLPPPEPTQPVDDATAEVASWGDSPPPAYKPPPAPPEPPAEQPPQPGQSPRSPVSFTPTNADEMWRYAKMLGRSKLLPKGFYDRRDYDKLSPRIDDVHFVLLKGQFLGLHPMVSIGNINIIDGKAEVGSLLMLAMVKKSGLMVPGGWKLLHSDMQRAVFKTRRVGDDDWTEFEYTIEEARLMGLVDKGRDEEARAKNQWRLQPRTMLRRRATSMLLREVYPDIVIGLYDHDELTEMREREIALGVDPDRVIAMNGITAGSQPALAEAEGPGLIAKLQQTAAQADPLKARLAARRAETAAQAVRSCSQCGAELHPSDSDPCIGCRPEPT